MRYDLDLIPSHSREWVTNELSKLGYKPTDECWGIIDTFVPKDIEDYGSAYDKTAKLSIRFLKLLIRNRSNITIKRLQKRKRKLGESYPGTHERRFALLIFILENAFTGQHINWDKAVSEWNRINPSYPRSKAAMKMSFGRAKKDDFVRAQFYATRLLKSLKLSYGIGEDTPSETDILYVYEGFIDANPVECLEEITSVLARANEAKRPVPQPLLETLDRLFKNLEIVEREQPEFKPPEEALETQLKEKEASNERTYNEEG